MSTLYVRDIPDILYETLKRRAKLHRRSLNQEMINIIDNVLHKDEENNAIWDEIDTLREKVFAMHGSFGDSAPLIRKDRER